jgi:hypothetical protein
MSSVRPQVGSLRKSVAGMNRAAEGTAAIGGMLKALLIGIGGLAVMGYGVYLIATHHVTAGLLLIFVGEPIIIGIADLATGLVLAVIVGIVGILGWSLERVARHARSLIYAGSADA